MNQFALDKTNGKALGVCAGIARATDTDPFLVRLTAIAIALLLGPVAILFYLLTAWLADAR